MIIALKNKIKQLTDLINAANIAYYNTGYSIMSDAEYDSLFNELVRLEDQYLKNPYCDHNQSDSPINKIGAKPTVSRDSNISKHCRQMYSLSNIYSREELIKFYAKINKLNTTGIEPIYTYEPKLDGVAVRLTYLNGQLKDAALRGDGTKGEMLYEVDHYIKNIPVSIVNKLSAQTAVMEVYGEVVISKEDFEYLNKGLREIGAKEYSNARNCAAGVVRTRLTNFNLQFIAHGFGYIGTKDASVEVRLDNPQDYLQYLGFTTPGNLIEDDIDNPNVVDRLPFDTDGIVIKIQQHAIRESLGYTARSPRWATAYKYPPKEAVTRLTNILYQVGRTGVITPVGVFDPVTLGGVTITNANLCNKDEMSRLGIGIGDLITVTRQAEVIPKIVRVVESANNIEVFPTKCPSCGGVLQVVPGVVAIKCINEFNTCKAILAQRIIHFTSREAMDVKGLGETIIAQLVDRDLVCDDIYTIYREDFGDRLKMLGISDKIISKIIANIIKSKHKPIVKFIVGLGLEGVGESKGLELAKGYSDTLPDDLSGIKELGWRIYRDVLGIK
jgi:DNA ligase (NAD+)